MRPTQNLPESFDNSLKSTTSRVSLRLCTDGSTDQLACQVAAQGALHEQYRRASNVEGLYAEQLSGRNRNEARLVVKCYIASQTAVGGA
jgi:hypothetical protein